jgi:hypothetical protein
MQTVRQCNVCFLHAISRNSRGDYFYIVPERNHFHDHYHEGEEMNGLTATGITVGICAGIWQLISSQVGLDPRWGLLARSALSPFAVFMRQAAVKGFVKSLFVNYTGAAWAFLAAMARVG